MVCDSAAFSLCLVYLLTFLTSHASSLCQFKTLQQKLSAGSGVNLTGMNPALPVSSSVTFNKLLLLAMFQILQ